MGKTAALLLVTGLLGIVPAILAGTMPATETKTVTVTPSHYDAFWLWSGRRLPGGLPAIRTLYLHQGEVLNLHGKAVFMRQGQPVASVKATHIWLTVRLETLALPDDQIGRMVNLLLRWKKAGNHVVGLQLDFDAATGRLAEYGVFLQRVRAKMPADFALGVTGLLDWAQTGSVAQLNLLPIDEIVVQTYQGKRTVPGYQRYLPALQGLHIPFRIGLVENGNWGDMPGEVRDSAWFRGYVVFLVQ
ncbi:hypothetical protein DT73_08115 [Mangrovibacter sp. MFB070]|uniref:DUF3142 domain-containing protein n=1 Tax=Mangrovibacter sp. MFB070 TaxID=1224318 RepID=UPI0004D5410E|nr:DUF3142 domain-containing protein [Mangrovibacter sp. MFB070]KEA53316.1 hypothetical protein DT73_08115 [Mangrovibacter sp. MFB070]